MNFANPLQLILAYGLSATILISIGYFSILRFKEKKAKIRYSLSNYINNATMCLSASHDAYYNQSINCPREWADSKLYKKTFIKYNKF